MQTPRLTTGAKEAAMRPVNTPLDLCGRLHLHPSHEQIETMLALTATDGVVNATLWSAGEESDRGEALRAAAMVALWRALLVRASHVTVLAPAEADSKAPGALARLFMAFLDEVCRTADERLAEMCRYPSWNRLIVLEGSIRAIPLLVNSATLAAENSLTGVILDAGNKEMAFQDAVQAFEGAFDSYHGLLIRLW